MAKIYTCLLLVLAFNNQAIPNNKTPAAIRPKATALNAASLIKCASRVTNESLNITIDAAIRQIMKMVFVFIFLFETLCKYI